MKLDPGGNQLTLYNGIYNVVRMTLKIGNP
jgi:hypothetical protein